MSERTKIGSDVRPLSGCLTTVSTMENVFLNEREGSKEHRSEFDHKIRLERQNTARNTSTERKQLLDLIDKTTTLESLSNEMNEPVLDTEKLMLNAFLNEVRTVKPACLKNWSALQHYVYFIYRHVVSEKPSNNTEIFPNSINKKIRDLIESLLQEDLMQLFIRLVTLIREYAMICRGFFDNIHNSKMATCLISLMSYYSAFCSAASKLAPLLPEFDFLIMERFNINWLCLNKSIFYHHIYLSSSVQDRILPVLQKLKEENKLIHKNLLESYACFSEDMKLIASRWTTLKIHISTLSHKRALSDPKRYLLNDWKMFEEQKKILKTNYWITRSTQSIQVQEMGEFDAHILSLVDDTAYVAEFLIDSQGQCMCEDCLAAEFRSNSTNVVIPLSFQNNTCTPYRLITCYICQDPIALDGLISHIATKHYDSHIQKTSSKLYVTSHPKRISKKTSKTADSSKFKEAFCFEGLLDRNLELKESIIKLVSGRDFRNNTTAEEKIDRIYVKDSKTNDLLLMSKKASNCSDNSLDAIDTEKLKSKTSSFAQVPEGPFIIKSPVSSVFQTSCETVQTKEPVFKIASEPPPVMQNENEIIFKCAAKTNNIGDTDAPKTSINELFRRHETCNNSELIKTAVTDLGKWKNANRIDKKAFKTLERNVEHQHCSNNDTSKSACENSPADAAPIKPFVTVAATNSYVNCINGENVAFRKSQPKSGNNVDQKMLELLQNANGSKSHVNGVTKTSDSSCAGHACGHKCKQGDRQTDAKKQDGTDFHKESRKCDCAYCEVFGTTISTHAHKTSETRDRLRSRLNQRREKVNESISKISSKPPTANSKLNGKSSSNINCAIKLSGNPKLSPLIEKTSTGISKVNIRPQNETSQSVPARIPEINQSVLVSTTVKSGTPSTESKKPTNEPPSLNCKSTINKGVAVCTIERSTTDTQLRRSSSSLSTNSLASDSVDSRDINELLNYIEGNKSVDKAALAQKKAAKKARQRYKKIQEKERIEKERQLKEEEKKMREEARKEEQRKAEKLILKVSEKSKKKKQLNGQSQQKQEIQKVSKKKNKNIESPQVQSQEECHLIEETIPAMVTIKRVCDGNNSPATVTITLKGSTPESDKLLFTLVNGQSNKEQIATAIVNSDKFTSDMESSSKANSKIIKDKLIDNSSISKKTKKKKKKEKELDVSCGSKPATKEVKVTIAVDKSNVDKKTATNRSNITLNEKLNISDFANYKRGEEDKHCRPALLNNVKDNEINLPMLRLPPGITITKIEGPPINKNCKPSSSSTNTFVQTNHTANIPVGKSGVIVVDTEKLIQQSTTSSGGKRNKKKSRRKRDPKNLEFDDNIKEVHNEATRSSMVTLKNPIFHTLQTALTNKVAENSDLSMFSNNQQASIFKNENGMVTIRSPRLHSSYDNGSPLSNFLSDLKPMFGAEVPAPFVPMCYSSFAEDSKNTVLNAQEILSGLPGIEITKVDKTLSKSEHENKKASQPAEVSIIPTNSSNSAGEKFNFDRDDWPFESVFTPKDVLEEDMDAEERELEAFKRFCQQSIPPERKEKVAHLNVKDIILNKKRDVTYS